MVMDWYGRKQVWGFDTVKREESHKISRLQAKC